MKCGTLVVLLLATVTVLAADKPAKEPAALVQARKVYEAKIKAVVDPIKDAYVKQLEKMKRAYGAKGDLTSALAVQREIDSLTTAVKITKITIVGVWAWPGGSPVTFQEDGTAKASNGGTAKWTCLDKKTLKYQVSWSSGVVDWLLMSPDGTTLVIKNSRGETYTTQKLREP